MYISVWWSAVYRSGLRVEQRAARLQLEHDRLSWSLGCWGRRGGREGGAAHSRWSGYVLGDRNMTVKFVLPQNTGKSVSLWCCAWLTCRRVTVHGSLTGRWCVESGTFTSGSDPRLCSAHTKQTNTRCSHALCYLFHVFRLCRRIYCSFLHFERRLCASSLPLTRDYLLQKMKKKN